jgi:hypothetical protein
MNYKKVLVLAVGGGNDSVSTLLLQQQLNRTFGYCPEQIDIVAVLPDCLDYHNLTNTKHPLLSIINNETTRSIGDKMINAFPERILSQNKSVIPELNINHIYGISMSEGSYGVLSALEHLVSNEEYDLVLSIDVGGDFIACEENVEVLSPMMDGYMLFSLKELEKYINQNNIKTEMLFCVLGLGTDGESSPEMLHKALSLIPDVKEHSFNQKDISSFVDFYRNIVEPNRYSRTTDYTIREITGELHDNPSGFRGRFHTKKSLTDKSTVYYGNFEHQQDPSFYGKYYLFNNIDNVLNLYSNAANNGIEWFISVQKENTKINHELNGQSYTNIGKILNKSEFNNLSLLFGTPSRKFNEKQQKDIVKDISESVLNNVYDFSLIYNSYSNLVNDSIHLIKLNNDLSIISLNKEKLTDLVNFLGS